MNYKKIFAIKESIRKRILKICPDMKNESGIYIWHRVDENGYGRFYCGQAKHLVDRSIQHFQAYNEHLYRSIRKHGLKAENKPYGWELDYFYCPLEELNEKETATIKEWLAKGMIPYNITGGSQGVGKVDINERKASKGYYDGLKKGYDDCKKYVKELFGKYLDFEIKGESGKIKERKKEEFTKFLGE